MKQGSRILEEGYPPYVSHVDGLCSTDREYRGKILAGSRYP